MSRKRNSPRPQQPRADRAAPSSSGSRSSPSGVRAASSTAQHKQVQDLIDLLKQNSLTELEWECDTYRVRLRHDIEPRPAAAAVQDSLRAVPAARIEAAHDSETAQPAHLVTITSPIVGTFYRSAAPDADPYVEESDYVKKGQVLCIVEAMKLMNEIESEVDGRVVKVLAESAKPVEYGQALFLIDPSAQP